MSGERAAAPERAAAWLSVGGVYGLDMATLARLHARWSDPFRALRELRAGGASLAGVVRPGLRPFAAGSATVADPVATARAVAAAGARLVVAGGDGWPVRLAPGEEWPAVLGVLGELPAGPAVAIVGMRRSSPAGAEFARHLAAELAASGAVVVSGLAFGIDAAAHRGCLEVGGRSVAVLAGGVANVSPRRHEGLAAELVAAGGALVSHVPPDAPSPGWRFPVRNRLVAGLADVVVVVEAQFRSGSLSTARHALDLGRPLCAVPGAPWSPRAAGTNALLADGAVVCRDADDIRMALDLTLGGREAPFSGQGRRVPAASAVRPSGDPPPGSLPAEARRVLDVLAEGPLSLERVAAATELDVGATLAHLNRLEAAGLVSFPTPAPVRRVGAR